MKRTLFLLGAVIIAPALLFATGTADPPAKMAELVTLTYLTPEHPNSPLTDDLPVLKEIERRINVRINYQTATSGQAYTEKLNVIIASGDLPDLINTHINTINEYADKAFTQLDPLIAKYGPSLKKVLTPDVKIFVVNNQGKIYGIPRTGQPRIALGWLVRRDWLDKLNLKKPETLEDWETVLKAFKTGDCDGNGKDDTLPLTSRGLIILSNTMPAFGMVPGYGEQHALPWQPDGDKVVFLPTTTKFKEMVTWLNKLVTEGLLDKEYIVLKTKEWTERMFNGISGATPDFLKRAEWFDARAKEGSSDPDFDITTCVAPRGPRGERGLYVYPSTLEGYCVGITTSCKNKEAALRWIDYVFSDGGTELYNWGIKGDTWDYVDGKKQYIGEYAKDLTNWDFAATRGMRPMVYPYRFDQVVNDLLDGVAYPESLAAFKESAPDYYLPPISLIPYFTDEEMERQKELGTNIGNLVTEYRDAMIVGAKPLGAWDEFQAQLKKFGVEEYTMILEAAYKRYLKVKESL